MEFSELFLTSLVVLVLSGCLLLLRNLLYWRIKGIPHDPPHFLYGNVRGLGKSLSLKQALENGYKKFKGKSPFFGMYFSIVPMAVATDLELIKSILIKDFNYFNARSIFNNEKDDPLTATLLAIDGDEWRSLRTKLSPAFSCGKTKFMFPAIVNVGQSLENALSKIIEKDCIVDMKELFARFTTDVIGTCAFGIECNSLMDPFNVFRAHGKSLFLQPKLGQLGRGIAQAYPKLARALKIKWFKDETINFFKQIVIDTIKYREENRVTRNDFLDILLAMKNECNTITLEQITGQVVLFFAGGFETSSSAMGFCLYEIAQNETIQDKLRKDIIQVLNKYDGKLTYEAVTEMTYLEQVVNETMRKYPPFPIINRKCLENYMVKGTNHIIEKDTTIFIPIYSLHNDPELYPNPSNFDPNRFTPEQIKERHSCAYLPFGNGPRNCIAMRFGKMQVYVGLIVLIKNFKFRTCASTEIPLRFNKESFTLTPEGKIDLQIEKM